MSNLPKLKQEISEHPSKNAVTAPNDPRAQEADIDRKMRLYGVIQGFRNGNLPSNQQIDATLDEFVNSAPFDTRKLSREGQQLIEQFRKVVLDAKKIIDVKNKDELIQNFIFNTTKFDAKSHADNLKQVSAPTDKSTVQNEGNQAVENLRVLAKLVFTNSEVRKLLSDVSVLGRDVVADAAVKVAEKARPDEDALRQAEEPAPDAQWIAPDGSKRGPNQPVPDTGVGEKVQQAREMKDQAKNEAQHQAQQQQQDAQRHAQHVDPNDREQQKGAAKDQANQALNRAQNVAQKVLPGNSGDVEHQKERARGVAEDTKNQTVDYFKDKFPEERRNRFIYRLKKVVAEQQQHDDYTEAVEFFLDMAEKYKGHAESVKDQSANKGQGIRNDPAYSNAEMELRIILERFANNTSMQPILDALDQLYVDAQNDRELRQWWHNAAQYIRRVLLEEGYVMEDQCEEDGKHLRDSGRRFWDDKYRGHREELFNSIEEFFLAYNEDPLNKQLGVDVKNLIKSLVLDGNGNLQYKAHLIKDLRQVIIPEVVKQIGYVPIPRAEYQDNQFDIVIENLTVELSNLLPNLIEIENRNYFKLSAFDNMGDYQQHAFTIGFSQVQADLRDVAFYFKKKTGFPKLQDQGLADVLISGKGISGKITLETTPNRHSIFKVDKCEIDIDELKFKIRDSKHNMLYNLVRHTATKLIKNAVAKAMQLAIRQALVNLDQQLTDIRDAADEGYRRDDTTRIENVKQRLAEKKQKADERAQKAKEVKEERNAEFNIVMSRDQEGVKWESPNSYVGKEGAVSKQASKTTGGWKSPVFDIHKPSPNRNEKIVNQKLDHY